MHILIGVIGIGVFLALAFIGSSDKRAYVGNTLVLCLLFSSS